MKHQGQVQFNHAKIHIMWLLLNAGMSCPGLDQRHKVEQYLLTLQAFKYAP